MLFNRILNNGPRVVAVDNTRRAVTRSCIVGLSISGAVAETYFYVRWMKNWARVFRAPHRGTLHLAYLGYLNNGHRAFGAQAARFVSHRSTRHFYRPTFWRYLAHQVLPRPNLWRIARGRFVGIL